MFEKNLNDLVRGLRNNKNNESKFVTECLDEIKQELRQENMAMKANAVLKLSYIQMLGYDISWAAFNIIEVMSSPKFTHKRISYMAASQCFHTELDVLMLATNLIKKDMNSQNQYDAGSAMVGLSCFVSPDLARDLANDIMSMMVSSRPYIRKRAILLMYKVFLNFPEALRPAFPRLKERLEDPDQGVQCAAVNVICELARKNPKNYLALAPLFFKLMTTSSNNWMLIKIIKLFGALCPLEPRLGKKLLEPLTSLIHRSASNIKKSRQEREFVIAAKKMLDVKSTYTNGGTSRHGSPSHSTSHKDELAYCITGISTSAMSLLYECINTVISGLPDHQASMQLCVSKLRLLIEDQDQNLKYLGLLLLNKILKAQPKIVIGHKDLILQCLDDRDESIRYRALDLIVGMISKKTLMDIIKKLMVHMEKAEGSIYRDELLAKIIEMCSQSNFQYITNFEWYIDVLLQLSDVEGTKHGRLIANQMLDVAIRVKAVRQYAVPVFSSLLAKPSLMTSTNEKNTSAEVLFAAAWVAGEYAEFLTDIHTTVASLVNPKVKSLPAHIQCVYIQAIGKLFSRVLTNVETDEGDDEEIEKMSESLVAALPVFTQSSDLEVQDRSCCVMQLIKLVMKMKKEGVQCAADVKALFAEELLPVAPKAQKKVPVPEGLDLDKWINEPLSDDESDDDDVKPYFMDSNISSPLGSAGQKEKYYEPDEEELERAREIRRMFQESNPHYLKGSMTNKKSEESASNGQQGSDVTDIPVKELDLSVSLKIQGEKGRKGKKRGKKGKKGRHASESEEEPAGPAYEIAPVIDLAGDEVVGDNDMSNDDPHDALNIDLDTPLGADEVLPVQTHRIVTEKSPEPSNSEKKKTKKSKTSKDGKKRTKSKDGETDKEKTGKKDKSGKKSKKRTSSLNKEKLNKEEAERKATLLKLASQAGEQSKASNANKESDDMEFWLSPTSTNTQENGEANTAVVSNEKEIEKTSEEKREKEAGENTATNEKNTKKKSRKEKTSKEKTGKEKKKKNKKTIKGGESSETPQEPPPDVMIMDLEEPQQDPYVHYKELCRDGNIQLLYEIRCDPIQNTQVICSTIFRNLTPNHIQKLEFNVLDSLNMKLIRQVGAAAHEPVLVPFQLLPNMTNEGQFAFTVDSVVMSQFLRGTLTYILKEADGSTSEKLDFRLSFPVSSFFHTHVITSDEFTSLLASGELKEKQSIKLDVSENLDVVVDKLSKSLRITVVEKIEGGVSMYGETVQKHALCLLLKKIDDNKISIDGKSGDFQLLSSIMKELKSSLEGS